MKSLIVLFLFLLFSSGCSLFSSEIFIIPLTHSNFSFSIAGVKFQSSLLNMPDLPSWLHYAFSAESHFGYIYGAPPKDIYNIQLEVIATDSETFNTSRRVIDLTFEKHLEEKRNEIHFKVINMNVDELIVPHRMDRLQSVLVGDLWAASAADGVFVSILPATLKGDRLPLRPQDKEGAYVSFASSAPFSTPLEELEMEVKPLWQHRPCPKYFKKASYERYFRQKGFAIDWCSFKLHVRNSEEDSYLTEKRTDNTVFTKSPVPLTKKTEVKSRSYVWDVIYTILIPLVVMFALLALLTIAMCCHRTNIVPNTQPMHLAHYAGVNKALVAVRGSVKNVRRNPHEYSPHPSTVTTTTSTHVDTLPRSRTASLSCSLPPRGSATPPSHRFEDYATLTRPQPPPYQRNFKMENEDFGGSSDF